MKNPLHWLSLFSAIVFLWQLFKLSRGLQTQSWLPTRAVIQSVSMDARDQGDGDLAYYAKVEYNYHLNGKSYTSRRITYSETSQLSHEKASTLLSGLKPGIETQAFYNPTQPDMAVLHQGIDRASGLKLAAIGALTLGCLLASVFSSQ